MEAGDCPPLNINAMLAISVKSYLKYFFHRSKVATINDLSDSNLFSDVELRP